MLHVVGMTFALPIHQCFISVHQCLSQGLAYHKSTVCREEGGGEGEKGGGEVGGGRRRGGRWEEKGRREVERDGVVGRRVGGRKGEEDVTYQIDVREVLPFSSV